MFKKMLPKYAIFSTVLSNTVEEVMSKLVFDATGKYLHPTRYRQIVEKTNPRILSSSAQDAISEDQKHNSVLARVHYQKRRSREVDSKAHAFLERLQGYRRSELEMDVRSRLSENSNSSQEQDVGKTDTSSTDEENVITETTREPLVGVPKLWREKSAKEARDERDCSPRGRQIS